MGLSVAFARISMHKHQGLPATTSMASLTETIMAGLADGTACFEYVDATETPPSIGLPFASISSAFSGLQLPNTTSSLLYARKAERAGQARRYTPQALKLPTKNFPVRRVARDERSMFRALALGIVLNKKKQILNEKEAEEAEKEAEKEADALGKDLNVAICGSDKPWTQYEEAVNCIIVEESLTVEKNLTKEESVTRYCERILSPNFRGGDTELKVLSKRCSQHIIVREEGGTGSEIEYVPENTSGKIASRPVRLLKSRLDNGSIHYDLLTDTEFSPKLSARTTSKIISVALKYARTLLYPH